MLQITTEQLGTTLRIRLAGSIGEDLNLDFLLANPPSDLLVNCAGITRVNSHGAKGWIQYFRQLKAANVRLRFEECSVPLIEQINLMLNFLAGGTVESFYLPYLCKPCGKPLLVLRTAESLKSTQTVPPEVVCPTCQTVAEFDDHPEEYLAFLSRLP